MTDTETALAEPPAPAPDVSPAGDAPADPPGALDLWLHPDDVDRLLRLPEVARLRAGRTRPVAARLIWHDTPDGDLAAEGLSLCERQLGRETVWRLERLRGAADAPWICGAPPPLVAEAATLDHLAHRLPAPLLPVAACAGTLRRLPNVAIEGGLAMSLLQGTLRAVTGEEPVARLRLDGPCPDIEALALALTEHVRLAVSSLPLAAEAARIAGRAVTPPALGAPAPPAQAPVSEACAAILSHLTGVMLHWAGDAGRGVAPEPVHQMRVALRRLRSALSLFRRALGDTGRGEVQSDLRFLLQVLGPARDWDVFTSGTGRRVALALAQDRSVGRLLAAAERRRQDSYAALAAHLHGAAFRRLGIRLACLAAFRPWERMPPDDAVEALARMFAAQAAPLRGYAGHALSRRLDKLLAQGENLSDLTPADLHALRIQGKRLRYAAEFFAPLYPARECRRFLRRIAALQERLGRLNDNTVAAHLMADLAGGGNRGYAVGVVRGFVAAGQLGARARMERSWRKFRRAEPFWD